MGTITNPRANAVVRHTGWNQKSTDYPCDVLIVHGSLTGTNGGVSNFWHWKRILPDMSLSPTESGYGSFTEPSKRYRVEVEYKLTEQRYIVRDREAGNWIERGLTYNEATDKVKQFEEQDRAAGWYSPDFYEIVEE